MPSKILRNRFSVSFFSLILLIQKCCDGCCHNPDKHCIGFAYSSVLGCLKPKSMKGVAQVFGIHALCEDVPDDPSFSVQGESSKQTNAIANDKNLFINF